MPKEKSLIIGRFQPFHEGHKKLIQTVLDEGKSVVVGVRDTPKSEDNPYRFEERSRMIRDSFPDKHRVHILKLPDINEVVHGRKVGWKVREIRLDEETERISGTEIRKGSGHH